MTKIINIRNSDDRDAMIAKGFKWVTIIPRGDRRGVVLSKHATYAAADRAAKGLDRAIVETSCGDSI